LSCFGAVVVVAVVVVVVVPFGSSS